MPLYEYQCDNGHRFEKIQKFSDPPIATCPTCGAAVRKLMSSPAIQFKGTGWYITDYAKKDSTAAGKTERTESSGSSSSSASGTKTEAKSETKTEAKSDKSS